MDRSVAFALFGTPTNIEKMPQQSIMPRTAKRPRADGADQDVGKRARTWHPHPMTNAEAGEAEAKADEDSEDSDGEDGDPFTSTSVQAQPVSQAPSAEIVEDEDEQGHVKDPEEIKQLISLIVNNLRRARHAKRGCCHLEMHVAGALTVSAEHLGLSMDIHDIRADLNRLIRRLKNIERKENKEKTSGCYQVLCFAQSINLKLLALERDGDDAHREVLNHISEAARRY